MSATCPFFNLRREAIRTGLAIGFFPLAWCQLFPVGSNAPQLGPSLMLSVAFLAQSAPLLLSDVSDAIINFWRRKFFLRFIRRVRFAVRWCSVKSCPID